MSNTSPASPETNLLERVVLTKGVGEYGRVNVRPTCGLASARGLIGKLNDTDSFYSLDRFTAGLLWFSEGSVEYNIDIALPPGSKVKSLAVAMEICSEAPGHNDNWLSDITLWINENEVGTWTSPGDFGGERGKVTPEWWSVDDTQFGLLKTWSVGENGTSLDGAPLSPVTIHDLAIDPTDVMSLRLGVKPDAAHVGGLNLFGRTFGNYPQDFIIELVYEKPKIAGKSRKFRLGR